MIVAYWAPVQPDLVRGDDRHDRAVDRHVRRVQPTATAAATHGTMVFNGSTATNNGGSMSMFGHRTYNYDPNLLWLTAALVPDASTSRTPC